MGSTQKREAMRIKRKKRIRKKVQGTPQRPRLTVFRSARHIYAQIIDDTRGETLASASTMEKQVRDQGKYENKVAAADEIGKLLAQRASGKGITSVVFDRNGYMYHGRVRAVSEAARKNGLDF
ncbi:large subunit ribosomal protein L18 [Desulfosalsimonas propionicica]|uniref:Large ribosomal subunit protein uL18 n=1 Tax=Desulfosalsimonas propionicica TaxID=332175 RepID=A0A7W0CA38_9BACT|nr:50S ribosomal protein L18 [Desulfosalsimonas propionicica]MBA2881947.1 large subunit ribosomal protein L18 [Desulfosalsimonas propionicica]